MRQHKTYGFDIKDMLPIGVTLIVVGLVLAFGLQISGDVKVDIAEDSCKRMASVYNYNATSGQCHDSTNTSNHTLPNTAEYNATGDSIEGVSKLSEKIPLIATVVVAVIIIGILVAYFARKD